MTPEQAAARLDSELRPFPWYIAVGIGGSDDDPTLFVYVRTSRHRKLRELADGWNGYRIAIEKLGSMRPITLPCIARQRLYG